MPWQPNLPGLAESSLDTLLALMTAKASDLNSSLSAITPAISLGVTVDSTFFRLGDPDSMPDGTQFPFWCCVVGGGRADGRDTTIEIKQSGPGYWATIYHNIYFYLNPKTFPGTDPVNQAALRERFRARFQDWLTWDVFNNGTNYTITLGSRQFATSPAFDSLDEAKITDVTKGYVLKSFGGTQWVYMAHFTHQARVYGGY